jgi:hypothetical protein
MSMPSEHHDYITGSVAGVMTLVIVAAGLLLLAVWFFAY